METSTSSQLEVIVKIRYVTKDHEETVQADRFPYLIGRDSSSVQLALPDATVSRKHAQLIFQDGAVLLENISETNKTAINGKYIDGPTPLHTGDQAILGSSKLFFEIQPTAGIASPATEVQTEALPVPEQAKEMQPKGPEQVRPPQSGAPKMEARFCRQCGEQLPAGAAFCGNCGTAAQAEITGQPMFCGSCGTKVGQDFQFCPQCGKPVGQNGPQPTPRPSPPPASPAAPKKRKKGGAGIVAAILAVVVIATVGIKFVVGRSYETVVKQYIDATFDGDYKKVWNLFPKEMQEAVMDQLGNYGYDDLSDIWELAGDSVAETLERADEEFGKNWRHDFEIVDEDDLSPSELKAFEEICRLVGAGDMEVDAGKRLEVQLTISGKNGKKEEDTIYMDVLKIGRSWYLGSFS